MWFTPQTERVIVLSKILALNKSLALLLSVLLAASVGKLQSNNTGGSDVTTILSKPRMLFTCARPILEFFFFLLANNTYR